MNAHERAEYLFRKAEERGKDAPSEEMTADAFSDMEFNHQQELSKLRATLAQVTKERDEAADVIHSIAIVLANHFGSDTLSKEPQGFPNTLELICKDFRFIRAQLAASEADRKAMREWIRSRVQYMRGLDNKYGYTLTGNGPLFEAVDEAIDAAMQ